MQGPAFSSFFKLLAVALALGMAYWFARLWMDGKVTGGAVSILSWFLAALAMILFTVWHILRSVTTLASTHIQQTWMWNKSMALRELAYGKLIRVRGLEWLIAPRVYLRTLEGKFAVFYSADPAMIAEFERLLRELGAFRKLT